MESRRQNTTERRLAHVRAIKDRFFSSELTIEEQLEAKDARITLLENQVIDLKRQLERAERRDAEQQRSAERRRGVERRNQRPLPEPDSEPTGEPPQRRFDFYRD